MCEYLKQISKLPGSLKYFIITEIILGVGLGIWNLNLNFFLSSQGMDSGAIGKIVAICPLITALTAVISGYFCDRLGYKISMLTGCALKSLAMLLTALAKPGVILYLARGLNGFGDSFVLICVFPYITSMVNEDERNTVYSLLFAVTIFSTFLGNVAGGVIMDAFKYTVIYRFLMITSAAMTLTVTGLRCWLPVTAAHPERKNILLYFPKQKPVIAYLCFDFLGYIAFFLAYSMLNLIYRNITGLSEWLIGITLGLSTVISSLAIFLTPPMAKNFGRTKLSTMAISSVTILYLVMGFSDGFIFIFLAISTSLMQYMLVALIDGPMLNSIPEGEKGGYSGLKLLLTNFGTSIGTLAAGGFLKNITGYTLLYIMAGILMAIQIPIYIYGFKQELEAK